MATEISLVQSAAAGNQPLLGDAGFGISSGWVVEGVLTALRAAQFVWCCLLFVFEVWGVVAVVLGLELVAWGWGRGSPWPDPGVHCCVVAK